MAPDCFRIAALGANTRRPSPSSTAVMPSAGRNKSCGTTGVGDAPGSLSITLTAANLARSSGPKLDTPTEHDAGGDVMVATDRCHAHAWLLRFHHDRELFFVRKAATVRPTITRRVTWHGRCRDSFSRPVLSSAANVAAYLRAGTRMKLRSPINFDLAIIDRISPAALVICVFRFPPCATKPTGTMHVASRR
jgi:hypothetical protein